MKNGQRESMHDVIGAHRSVPAVRQDEPKALEDSASSVRTVLHACECGCTTILHLGDKGRGRCLRHPECRAYREAAP